MTTPNAPPLPTLPIQLLLTMGAWLSWPFALQCAKSESLPLNSRLKNLLPAGPKALAQFEEALQEEARSRASNLLDGVLRYLESPYDRDVSKVPCVWQKGNARLLDYGRSAHATPDQPMVLFIPSLINRYYILDLEEERSLLRFMAAQDIYPMVLDWGIPEAYERRFSCSDYITEILIPAIDFITASAGQKIILAGYCMGGVMTLAAAQLRRNKVAALALMATPWDFHCEEFATFILENHGLSMAESLIGDQHVPADVIHSLFYMTDPWIFEQKFRRFSALQPESRVARDFIALERWVNDGVPMTANVARECMLDWAQRNILAKKQWKVAGRLVDPRKINLPSFIAIPRNDHVVPHGCAMALAQALPHAQKIHPGAGHVGMIVGTHAKRELWHPLAEWIVSQKKYA